MSELVAMTSSSPPTKICCFNTECRAAQAAQAQQQPQQFRNGWRLRNGRFAPLCLRCAAAFEEGKFCNTFHLDAPGWRNCESCGKRVHCGCIVSVHAYILLDAGGIDCVSCVRKHISMVPSQIWPPSSSSSLPVHDRLKDLSAKNLNQVAGPSTISEKWGNVFNIWNASAIQSDLNPRMQYDVDRVKQIEKKRLEDPSDRANSANLALMDSLRNANAAVDLATRSHSLHRDETSRNGFQGKMYEARPRVNFSLCSSSPIEDLTSPNPAALSNPLSAEANGFNSSSVTQSQKQTLSPPAVNQFNATSRNAMDPSSDIQNHVGRPPVDTRGRGPLLPRNSPKITDQELQQISGDSNSVITPLFEKMLSASDAGRVGRLVLPKKCAEAYLPTITHSEGIPLEIRDAKGKEWLLHFRFWPNNNSRMYVLEGVTPCIQSMQLQAGDIVTFSRIEPEGKLVMGFRKAASVPPSEKDKQSPNKRSDLSKVSEVNNTPGYNAKDVDGYEASVPTRKRRCRSPDAKSKYFRMDREDAIELKLTWEEAQYLLSPLPNYDPSIVVVESNAFEEFEEAPIHGNPSILTTLQVGTPAKKDENALDLGILEEQDDTPKTTSRHPRHRPGCTCIVCIQPLSGKGTKHKDTCNCNVCLIMKRRKLSQINGSGRKKPQYGTDDQNDLTLDLDHEDKSVTSHSMVKLLSGTHKLHPLPASREASPEPI